MSADPVRVLSVVGPGRSGTTILGNILGETPGWFCGGEMRWFWRRGLIERRHCGCGQELFSCPVWGEVIERMQMAGYELEPTASGKPGATVRAVLGWQDFLAPLSRRPRLLRSPRRAPGSPPLREYAAITGALFSAVAEVTGADVIVDTSKRPHDAAVLGSVAGVRHHVVHVVRDPRAVAYSWSRVKELPGVASRKEMGRRRPAPSATRWLENCLGAELLRRNVPEERWTSLRYEDFAVEPGASVARLIDLVGGSLGPSAVAADGSVQLSPNHNVAGNPNRFQSGRVVIREDDEWKRSLPLLSAVQVTAITLPLLRRYGYRVHPE